MNRIGIALASLLFTLPGFAQTPKTARPKKAPIKAALSHKSKVPVTITTVFKEGKAMVTLRFNQAVEEAVIGVRGLDGLQVANVPPVEETSFARGEVLSMEVSYTPGSGRSHLAVDIEGNFRGQHRMGVQTFSVGKPSAEQLKASQSNILTTTGGQRIKLMPVKQD